MLPIVTPEEMAAIDRGAPDDVATLIGRAGAAVARQAVRMMSGTYGRTVVIVAGKGNNGNDGRDAARRLERRGVRTVVIDAADAPDRLPPPTWSSTPPTAPASTATTTLPTQGTRPCWPSTSLPGSTG